MTKLEEQKLRKLVRQVINEESEQPSIELSHNLIQMKKIIEDYLNDSGPFPESQLSYFLNKSHLQIRPLGFKLNPKEEDCTVTIYLGEKQIPFLVFKTPQQVKSFITTLKYIHP